MYGTGVDNFEEIVDLAVEDGIIKKSGSWYSYKDSKLGQGFDSVIQMLQDHPEMYQEIEKLVKV